MRKIMFILGILLATQFMTAQLKVKSDGKIEFGNSPVSTFGNIYAVILEGNRVGLEAHRRGQGDTSPTWGRAIASSSEISTYRGDIGVDAYTISATPLTSGRAIGVRGTAGNATNGYNYGVMGNLTGTNNGAGVIGTVEDYYGSELDGRYAGYFKGNVKVTGTVNGIIINGSDTRYKQNIVDLSSFSTDALTGKSKTGATLSTILQMNPVQYNLKQVYFESKSDTATVSRGFFDENSQMFQKKHYGLIAQDLQKLYPDLVYEDDNGYLAINYTGLIPLLIQSIKELNVKIEALESREAISMQKAKGNNMDSKDDIGQSAYCHALPKRSQSILSIHTN